VYSSELGYDWEQSGVSTRAARSGRVICGEVLQFQVTMRIERFLDQLRDAGLWLLTLANEAS